MRISILLLFGVVSTSQPVAAQSIIDSTAQAFKQWSDCVQFQHEMHWISEQQEALKLNGEMAFSACASEELLALGLANLAFSNDEGRRQGVVTHYSRRLALKQRLMEKSLADAKKKSP